MVGQHQQLGQLEEAGALSTEMNLNQPAMCQTQIQLRFIGGQVNKHSTCKTCASEVTVCLCMRNQLLNIHLHQSGKTPMRLMKVIAQLSRVTFQSAEKAYATQRIQQERIVPEL